MAAPDDTPQVAGYALAAATTSHRAALELIRSALLTAAAARAIGRDDRDYLDAALDAACAACVTRDPDVWAMAREHATG